MLTEQYPGSTGGAAGPGIGYAYDTMGRLNTMTDLVAQASIISATTYDPANRLLTMTGSLNETRTYNVMGQLTTLVNNSVNMTYSFSATQNNGKITGQTDNISGEQVVYAYDALNRLASAGATSNSWGQSYAYDGFGNLTNQTVTAGTAPSLSVTYNASTNRQSGDCADANGNINSVSVCGMFTGYGYDVSNRIVSVPGGTQYAYAPGNKRIWRGTTTYNQGNGTYSLTLDELTFWSVSGKKLATYNVSGDPNVIYDSGTPPQLTVTLATSNYYFGRKLIAKNTNPASPTYVGSDRLGSFGRFYPWGQEKPSATQNGTEKFTGYFRDAETGNDYAINRYHQPGMGRFLSTDPNGNSAKLTSPSSWNRYTYTRGDPVNRKDRKGLDCGSLSRNNMGDKHSSLRSGPNADDDDDGDDCDYIDGDPGLTDDGGGGDDGDDSSDQSQSESGGSCVPVSALFDPEPISPACVDYGPYPTPQQPQQQPSPACQQYMATFYDNFASELLDIASSLDTSFEMIVAFAAFESGWGNAAHMNNHNLFSEMVLKGGEWQMIHWNNFGNEEKYVEIALGKSPGQGGIQGIVDPTEFATQIVNIHWSGDPMSTYVNGFVGTYDSVTQYEPACLDAIAIGLSHSSLP